MTKRKIYFPLIGSFKEIISAYYTNKEWKYLKSIRKILPKDTLIGVVFSDSEEAKDLIKYNPYLNEVRTYSRTYYNKWKIKNHLLITNLLKEELNNLVTPEKPNIYLTEEEDKIIKDISSNGEYIVLSLFPENLSSPALVAIDYQDIIDQLNLNIVLIGGKNKIDTKAKNIYDLSSNFNSRFLLKLIDGSSGYMGQWTDYSYYSCLVDKKVALFTSSKNKSLVSKKLENKHCCSSYKVFAVDEKALDNTKTASKKRAIAFLNKEPRPKLRLKRPVKIEIEEPTPDNGIYFWVYGGYGDCSLAYIHGGRGKENHGGPENCGKGSRNWPYLRSLKEKDPNLKTKAIVISGNIESRSLIENNPLVDSIVYIPTLRNVNAIGKKVARRVEIEAQNFFDVDKITNINKHYRSYKNQVFLPEKDEELFQKIKEEIGEKYIAVHPFASVASRKPIEIADYARLAKRLVKAFDCKILILGNNYTKKTLEANGQTTKHLVIEEYPYENDYTINLVNKINLPISTLLVKNSIATVGSWSCHTTYALSIHKPSVVFTSPRAYSFYNPITTARFKSKLDTNLTFVTKNMTHKVIQKIINHLENYF